MADIKYKIRVRKHKLCMKFVAVVIKLLSLMIIKLSRREIEIHYSKEGYDFYTSCKHMEKRYCQRTKHWKMHIKQIGYVIFGSSETEMYFRAIEVLLIHPARFPFCK